MQPHGSFPNTQAIKSVMLPIPCTPSLAPHHLMPHKTLCLCTWVPPLCKICPWWTRAAQTSLPKYTRWRGCRRSLCNKHSTPEMAGDDENPSCNIIPLQAGSSQCTLVPALRQCGLKSCCNSAWALSCDLVLFKGFLSAAYPSSDSTDYKNTFKEKVFTWVSFMSCCIQHRLGESYLAASRHDSHWNKGHGKAKATVKQGSMAWANFLDRDKPFSLFVEEEPQAGHQAFKYLRTTARAIYTTLAQTNAVVCKIQNVYLFISKTLSWVLVSPATRHASQQAPCRNPPASLWAQGSSQADTPTPCFVEHTQSLCLLDQLPSS